jgi:hypothetical protein
MAYTPREIKDRVAVGDDIFQVEDLGNNQIRLIPAPTHVSEPGTPVNKALLQPIEDELGALSPKVDALKNKLDGIEAGAQVNTVTSVAGKTGAVTLSKSDVGLDLVQNYGVATRVHAEAGTANNLYMTPLRVTEAFNNRVVYARVNPVDLPSFATVTREASSPTDYNTIKFTAFLGEGESYRTFSLIFPFLGDVVAGTPQYLLNTSSTPSSSEMLEFRYFSPENKLTFGSVTIYHGITMFRQNRVDFRVVREDQSSAAINDIYLHFRFTGLKLA